MPGTYAEWNHGHEDNWVQTIPGKGWNTLLRLYGPLKPWFDKTWRPGEIELEPRLAIPFTAGTE